MKLTLLIRYLGLNYLIVRLWSLISFSIPHGSVITISHKPDFLFEETGLGKYDCVDIVGLLP